MNIGFPKQLKKIAEYTIIIGVALMFIRGYGLYNETIARFTVKPNYILFFIAGLLTLFDILKNKIDKEKKIVLIKATKYIALLLTPIIIANIINISAFNYFSQEIIYEYIKLIIAILIFLLILYHSINNKIFVQKCLYASIASLSIIPFIYFPQLVYKLNLIDFHSRVKGLFSDPNSFANFMIIPASFLFYLIINSKTSTKKIFYYLLFIISLVAIIGSGSRSGFLGLSISLLILSAYKIFNNLNKKYQITTNALLIFFSAMIISCALLPQEYNRYEKILTKAPETIYALRRADIWEQAFIAIRKKPFGYGLGYKYNFSADNPIFSHTSAHSIVLELFLIGGIFLFSISTFLFYLFIKNFSHYPLLGSIFIGCLIPLIFQAGISLPWLWILAAFVIGSHN